MICQGCGQRPPMYELGNGVVLCVDCAFKHQQIVDRNQRGLERMINYLTDEIEATVGFKLGSPRFPEPAPPVIQHSPTNVTNTISIDRSVVGTVNTGTIQSLNQSMNNVRNAVNEDTARVIKLVIERLLALKEFTPEQKQEFTERVTFLSDQAATPKENRKLTIIKESLDWINRLFTGSQAAMAVWPLAQTLFEKLFNR